MEASLLEVLLLSSSAAHEPILQPLLVPHFELHRHCDLPAASLDVSAESSLHAFAPRSLSALAPHQLSFAPLRVGLPTQQPSSLALDENARTSDRPPPNV